MTTTPTPLQQSLTRLASGLDHQDLPASTLYVIATPIGNSMDISLRALHTLHQVDMIACEDTRKTSTLLSLYGLSKKLFATHQHNEKQATEQLIHQLQQGKRVALVSDAGTPAISDPGSLVVQAVRQAGFRIIPLPGACALTAALSASGLVQNSFYFAGFLPARQAQRDTMLSSLRYLESTLVFYEAPHRLGETLSALVQHFEPERTLVVARELSKLFEEIHACPLSEAQAWLESDKNHARGEFVLLLQGASETRMHMAEAERILTILLTECSPSQAAALTAKITGVKKNTLYALSLTQKN